MKNPKLFYSLLAALCLLASLPFAALAQDPNGAPQPQFQDLFQSGVKLYQEKKFTEAKDVFQKAIEVDQNNIQALTNLGLTYFQLGEKGWALALLRKAHHLDPDFSTPTSALQFILPQLEVKEIPHEISTWETVRTKFIQPFSQVSFVVLAAILFFASGWIWISFFSGRKKAEEEEKPYPHFPVLGLLYTFGFLFLFSLMFAKFYDLSLTRGTIVGNKVPVLSLPDEKAPILFDLFAGLEVIALKNEKGWVQVQYPGGMTGWVKENVIYLTHGSY